MERLSHHAAAAHFNMCNGAEIVFSLAYTVALWYNVFTILRKARWLDVVCSLKLGQSECVLIDGWMGYIVVPFLRMDSLGRVVCRRLCAACRFDARLLEELQN